MRIIHISQQDYKTSINSNEILTKYGTHYVLTGTLLNHKSRIILNAQIIDVSKNKQIWVEEIERERTDLQSLRKEISKKVLQKLKIKRSFVPRYLFDKDTAANPEAYIAYLKALYYRNKGTTEGYEKSLEYLKKAIIHDPNFALAYTSLSSIYFYLSWKGFYPRTDGYFLAKKYILKSLDINENISDSHSILGAILCWNEWKWEEARKEFIKALDLCPNNVSAHRFYSELLDITRDNLGARKHINAAIEIIPRSAELYNLSALYYYHEGNHTAALETYRKTSEIDPSYLRGMWTTFFKIYAILGEEQKAVDAYQKYMYMEPLTVNEAIIINKVYENSGMDGLLSWLLELSKTKSEKTKNNYWFIASLYSMLDNKNEVLNCLEKMLEEQHSQQVGVVYHADQLPRINNDPAFTDLRAEPRFQALLNYMNLSKYFPGNQVPNIY